MEHFMQRRDRNGMDLTEAEDIKKRWQKYTKELYKKELQDPDNYEHQWYRRENDRERVRR